MALILLGYECAAWEGFSMHQRTAVLCLRQLVKVMCAANLVNRHSSNILPDYQVMGMPSVQ